MLTTTATTTTPTYTSPTLSVQTTQPYACPICGVEARGLVFWPAGGWRSPSPLDAYGAHIAYLILGCGCAITRPGCSRVAVLDDSIIPLRFATSADLAGFHERTAYNVAAVEAALAVLQAAADARLDDAHAAERAFSTLRERTNR